jgi:hypothetical protein
MTDEEVRHIHRLLDEYRNASSGRERLNLSNEVLELVRRSKNGGSSQEPASVHEPLPAGHGPTA